MCMDRRVHTYTRTVYPLIESFRTNERIILIASQLSEEEAVVTAPCMPDGEMWTVLCCETANHTMQSRDFFCLLETRRRERCLGWSWCWWCAGEARRSHWGHSYWKCTQAKMLLRKALSVRCSLACGSKGDWLVMYRKLVAGGCSVDKQCSEQS